MENFLSLGLEELYTPTPSWMIAYPLLLLCNRRKNSKRSSSKTIFMRQCLHACFDCCFPYLWGSLFLESSRRRSRSREKERGKVVECANSEAALEQQLSSWPLWLLCNSQSPPSWLLWESWCHPASRFLSDLNPQHHLFLHHGRWTTTTKNNTIINTTNTTTTSFWTNLISLHKFVVAQVGQNCPKIGSKWV